MFLNSSIKTGAVRRVSFLMNTWMGARLVCEQGMAAQSRLDEVFERLKDTERLLSRFRGDSEISRINREAARRPVRLSPAVFELLKNSLVMAAATGGAFDITMGPLVDTWRRAEKEQVLPSGRKLAEALGVTGYRHLRLDESRHEIRFEKDGIQLDMGAIGKGYALDVVAAYLKERGQRQAMLDAGGNILCMDARGCVVGIRHPLNDEKTVADLVLRDEAVATSANDQRFLDIQGRKFGHLLDPLSGWPVEGDLLSVSVIAPRAAVADALSTALFVMGPERGMQAAKKLGATKVVVIRKRTLRRIRVEEFVL